MKLLQGYHDQKIDELMKEKAELQSLLDASKINHDKIVEKLMALKKQTELQNTAEPQDIK